MRQNRKLREIAIIAAGQGAPQGEDNYCVDGTPFIKAGNLIELINGKAETEVQKVNEQVARNHKLKKYPQGTVLFAKSGMSCMKGYVYQLKNPCYVVSHLACIIPKAIKGEYLKYYFEFHKPNSLVKDEAYPSISLLDIGELSISYGSEAEQEEIVRNLDKINRIINKRRLEIQKIDDLVKSQFIEMFGDMASNDKCWDIVPLSEIAEYFNGLTYKPENVSDDGLIVFRSSNIQDSELDFADIVRVDSKVKEKLFVKDGDILMCSRNGSAKLVGKVAEINRLKEPATFGAFMMVIRSAYPKYLLTYFKLPVFREQIKVGATTTINQITSSMLDKIRLPLPPQVLINEYSQFVEQTDKSKFRIKQSLEKLEKCYKALLQKYFG